MQNQSIDIAKSELRKHYSVGWESYWLDKLDENLYPRDKAYRLAMEATIGMLEKSYDSEISILDVGCGIGIYDFGLARIFKNARILGVDISDKQVEIARNLSRKIDAAERIKFAISDIEELSIKGQFDYIICSEVLEHILNPDLALMNIKALCSINTKLIISVPQLYHGLKKTGIFYRQIDENGEIRHTSSKEHLDQSKPIYEYYHACYDYKSMEEVLERNGFWIEKWKGVNLRFPRDISHYNSLRSIFMRKLRNFFAYAGNTLLSSACGGLINHFGHARFAENLILRCRIKS